MKSCPICHKGTMMAGKYSNRVRATKFNPVGMKRKYPNLQWSALPTGGRIKVCTSCLKQNRQLKASAK